MTRIFVSTLVAVGLIGCATPRPIPPLNNPELSRFSNEKPAGYPKTFYVRVPDTMVCEEVSQDWRQDSYNGHKIWFRDEQRKTVNCPAGQ